MKVKEFLDVVTWNIIDYAKIYEMRWNEDYQNYDCKFIDKRVKSKADLEPYYDWELDYFDYETQWGEYDDSAIYIKMPKEQEPKNDCEFIICYTSEFGDDMWESVYGEDAMNTRVDELVSELGCESEEIIVFNREDELT